VGAFARRAAVASCEAIDRHAPLLLVALELVVFAIAFPMGNFPVNDDWSYAHSVLWLLEEHQIRLSDWIGMNLLPQTLLGGAMSLLFGFSFPALRAVTQLVSILVVLAAYRWFVAFGLGRCDAFVATVVVIATPFWGVLSSSYMTDLYVMVFAIPAATLFLAALTRPALSTLALATLLSIAGVLERQVVAVVPAAFLVASMATRRPWHLREVSIAAVPLIAVIVAELAYNAYLARGPGVPDAQQYLHGRVLDAVRGVVVGETGYRGWVLSNLVTVAGYLGLFVAPWAIWQTAPVGRATRALAGVLAAGVALASLAFDWWPPYRPDNVVDAAGIGPFMLYAALPPGLASLDRSPGVLWRVAGIGAAVGAAALAIAMLRAARSMTAEAVAIRAKTWFAVALVAVYLVPFVLTDYFDRYLLFVLPFVLALMWLPPAGGPHLRQLVAISWIVLALALGGAATHDYFTWNRARWAAIGAAEELGATPDTLDGGFEYNAFYRFERRPRDRQVGKSWWWVRDDRYVVAFSVPPGYAELQRFPVKRLLGRSPAVVYLSERTAR